MLYMKLSERAIDTLFRHTNLFFLKVLKLPHLQAYIVIALHGTDHLAGRTHSRWQIDY